MNREKKRKKEKKKKRKKEKKKKRKKEKKKKRKKEKKKKKKRIKGFLGVSSETTHRAEDEHNICHKHLSQVSVTSICHKASVTKHL